jgi:hypothetical protein
MYAIKRERPRRQQLWCAGSALLAYPFENSAEKVKAVGRVLIGESFYQRLRSQAGLIDLQRQSQAE